MHRKMLTTSNTSNHTLTLAHNYTYTYTHTLTDRHTHTYTHTQTHTRMHARTHRDPNNLENKRGRKLLGRGKYALNMAACLQMNQRCVPEVVSISFFPLHPSPQDFAANTVVVYLSAQSLIFEESNELMR